MAKDKTYKREVVGTITLVREGKRMTLTTGQVFEFNEEEYEQIMASNPKAISAKTVVDLDSGDVDPSKLEGEQAANQKSPPASTKGGKAKADDL